MKYLLLTLITILLLQGCTAMPAKDIGNTIKECTTNGLGFKAHINGINQLTYNITCCTTGIGCNFSRLKENIW